MSWRLTNIHFGEILDIKQTNVSLERIGENQRTQFILKGNSEDHRQMTIAQLEKLAIEQNSCT